MLSGRILPQSFDKSRKAGRPMTARNATCGGVPRVIGGKTRTKRRSIGCKNIRLMFRMKLRENLSARFHLLHRALKLFCLSRVFPADPGRHVIAQRVVRPVLNVAFSRNRTHALSVES
ncbi:hypothetical protein [Caballeronia arvi]|uniref:hypothetical protein n=1 Tax=Caballeronia arvi TaxID=1777135 RepID=UPI00117FE5AA|nr:hypothetical protein [Caballeronia arvi]